MKPYLAMLTWNDAVGHHPTDTVSVEQLDSHPRSMVIQTVGWILKDDDIGVKIAAEYCGDGDYRGVTDVLRSMVRDMRPLAVKRVKRVKDGGPSNVSDSTPGAVVRSVS